jgi:diguanylate cyclase (GGDEF)-like protein
MTVPLPPPRGLPTIRQTLARTHRRLVVLAVLLAAATLLTSGLLTTRNYVERNLELVAHTIAYTIEPAMVFGDPDAIREGIASVAGTGDVERVELYGPNGELLSLWTRIPEGSEGLAEKLTDLSLRMAPARTEIRHGDKLLGRLTVVGDNRILAGYLISGAVISLCGLGIILLAMRILAQRMEEGVIAPLDDIAAVAHAVRQDRAFDRRVQPSGIAELDRFGRDFNALLAELEGWHNSLTREKNQFEHEATHDALTGLGNRTLFERTLDMMVGETARSGEPFALVYFDADRFKEVNDLHGHAAGDALLVEIAARLRRSARRQDHAFRLGGDEFALILGPNIDSEMLGSIANRIKAAMAVPIALPSGCSIIPSLSMGAAIYRDDGLSPEELLGHADRDMYQDKRRKRGPSVVEGPDV